MPGEVEMPEEAVKLARIAEKMVFGQSSESDGLREVLAAAAPSIRSQERQRVGEALEKLPRLAISPVGNVLDRPGIGAFVRFSEIEAALDSLEDGDG